jgi:hypothetical protein
MRSSSVCCASPQPDRCHSCRLQCARRYIKKWQELLPVSSIIMQLITCIWVMLIFAHVAACLLILAAKLDGLPDSSWMVVYGVHQQADAMHAQDHPVPHTRLLATKLHALRRSTLCRPPKQNGTITSIYTIYIARQTCSALHNN